MERQRPKSTGILTRRARAGSHSHDKKMSSELVFSVQDRPRPTRYQRTGRSLSARERRRRVADYLRTAAASQNVVISQHPVMGGLHRRCMTDCEPPVTIAADESEPSTFGPLPCRPRSPVATRVVVMPRYRAGSGCSVTARRSWWYGRC